MDLATIEPALAAVASAITGVEAGCCVWENAPRPRHNGRLVTLSWVSNAPAGTDAVGWEYAPNADPLLEMTPTAKGHRKPRVQIVVEVHDQRPGYNAAAVVERARTRLTWPSVRRALTAAGLALAGDGEAVNLDGKVDGRLVSRRAFELRFNGVSTEADAAGRTSYIASVGLTPTIRRPDGAPVDSDLQPGGTTP